jgi:ribonuclease D
VGSYRNPETPVENRGAMTSRVVADQSDLLDVSSTIRSQTRIALDCEAAGFHRYTDRLCLVQLTTPEETFLFDTLAVDPSPALKGILENPRVQVVMHGADFDLRLIHRDLGIRLRGLFDTQAAATLLGASSIGLASLLEEHLGVKLSKEHQRADWAQRPLPQELLTYAADDTKHLLSLADILTQKLREAGRESWAKEEFVFLESIEWVEDHSDPVSRFKGARLLTPRKLMALRAALEWRDRIARDRDRAPFRVVGDSVLMAVVVEEPRSVEELTSLKGMSPRLARGHGRELLDELRRIEALPEAELPPYPRGNQNGLGRLPPEEEARVEAVRSLRAARAETLALDRGVLLSNAQINEIVRAAPRSVEALRSLPGVRGWQVEILGAEILTILGK